MATQLSPEELDDIKDTFSLFDRKGDNKVACEQVGDILRACNLNPTLDTIKKVTEDKPRDHRFTCEQFIPMYNDAAKSKDQGTIDDYLEGLKVFDKENNGEISSAELRHVLTTLGERLTEDEVEAVLAGFEDAAGNVNYEDWCNHVMTLPTYN
ncbi:myosin light chain 3, skeletal muscle isoform-like isoform X2 [Ptychodera flava]|uniref:myosin light chain 3, skeletal muscle isoform-like isoform X2 n=1 Tax=Ptychodera flava TaxID=63121 RepID=UPI00396A9477